MKTIEIPDSLPYPEIYKLSEASEVRDKFCYILKPYPLAGVSLTIVRAEGQVLVRLADWGGKLIDAQECEESPFVKEVMKYGCLIINFMKLSAIPKSQYYFSEDGEVPRLVDMRLSLNKFCGPGYLVDFFGKMNIPIQERVGEPIIANEDKIKQIQNGDGIYTSERYILKPSAFKSIMRGDNLVPLYVVIERNKTSETQDTPRDHDDSSGSGSTNSITDIPTQTDTKKD